LQPRLLGQLAQESRVKRSIEMIGIAQGPAFASVGAARLRRLEHEAIDAEVPGGAMSAGFSPEVLEVRHPGRGPRHPERMEIAIALAAPVLEGNAELEARSRSADEVALVDAQQLVEGTRSRNGGFAHPDGADLVGFDEHDLQQRPE